jgi:glycosyltransferase involved in cell wall biosynthesis
MLPLEVKFQLRPIGYEDYNTIHQRINIGNLMPPYLSIITAVRDQLPYNQLYFHSLKKYTFHPYELIIIDNGSIDGSGDFFEKHGAIVVRNRENLCYACSQNLGLTKASGKYVAFLNNDICLSKEWDRTLIRYLEEYELDVISPCGTETMETSRHISKSFRKWKRVNAVQRLRGLFGLSYTEKSLMALIRRMYGNWDKFTHRRAARFKRFLYPGISGFGLMTRKSFFDDFGPWTREVSASDFDLWLRLVKNHVEVGRFKQPMIAGDVYVHHFIRATVRTAKHPFKCNHPFTAFNDFYSEQDRRYVSLPAASVIIAVYNKPEFLEKIFVSLLNQTQKNFEIVIADDGSGPQIASCIKKYAPLFPYGIQHIRHEHCGFRKTIIANKAVIASRSNYLIFIDGDSLLHHRFVGEHLHAGKVGVVLSGRRVMLDKELSENLTLEDVRTGRIEHIAYWVRHCDKGSIKHGIFVPIVTMIEGFFRGNRNYDILGANFSLYRGDFYRINGYDERIIGRGLEDDNLANRFKVEGIHIRSMARRAIQYHLHHSFDPVPHSPEIIREMGMPAQSWSLYGIVKG